MAVGNEPGARDYGVSQKVLRLLEGLRRTQTGSVVYRQVERIINDIEISHVAVENAYAAIIGILIDAFATQLTVGSPLHIQIKLLRARLQPPLSASELAALREYIDLYGEQIAQSKYLDSQMFEQAMMPLLEGLGLGEDMRDVFGIAAPEPPVQVAPTPVVNEASVRPQVEPAGETPARRQADDVKSPVETPAPVDSSETFSDDAPDTEQPGVNVEQRIASVYRHHLDAKRKDIQKLQASLAQQVLETITQNEEFGVLLEVVLGELRQARDLTDVEQLRETLIDEVVKLLQGHNLLADKLDSTHQYLQVIETDSRQLTDELTRVRLLSLTDELTDLPNRRAFLRRLEDEVGRVQRYGLPLSLALIDLDLFKEVNDKYGHAAGDEVLRCYSKNILSIFRHHDMVARYGGEEFAVLLPNTDKEGALRALAKVKKRSSETRWQFNGTVRHVPTFSAGLALYKPGESPGAFIERADNALYRAKRLGRNRVELDQTYNLPELNGERNHFSPGDTNNPNRHGKDV
ncbi:MAG: GGDEF domain-containing protein [Gammaproteobacteria bacterium]